MRGHGRTMTEGCQSKCSSPEGSGEHCEIIYNPFRPFRKLEYAPQETESSGLPRAMELFWHAASKSQGKIDTSHRAAPTSRRKAQGKDGKSTSTRGKKVDSTPYRRKKQKHASLAAATSNKPSETCNLSNLKTNRFRPVWTHVFSSLLYKIDQVRLLTIKVHLFTD